jgi:hypothetical protein
MDAVYYRLYVSKNDGIKIVCMQSFDEDDYDQSRFVNKERYETEEEAELDLKHLIWALSV